MGVCDFFADLWLDNTRLTNQQIIFNAIYFWAHSGDPTPTGLANRIDQSPRINAFFASKFTPVTYDPGPPERYFTQNSEPLNLGTALETAVVTHISIGADDFPTGTRNYLYATLKTPQFVTSGNSIIIPTGDINFSFYNFMGIQAGNLFAAISGPTNTLSIYPFMDLHLANQPIPLNSTTIPANSLDLVTNIDGATSFGFPVPGQVPLRISYTIILNLLPILPKTYYAWIYTRRGQTTGIFRKLIDPPLVVNDVIVNGAILTPNLVISIS
ncbi:MAG: hypothetical protein ACRC78_02665 [Planktothrix sp.]